MMYTVSSLIANWILIKPTVFKATAIFLVWSLICCMTNSPKLNGGNVALESPECTPQGSMCSIIPMMYTFPSASQMASASASIAPSK